MIAVPTTDRDYAQELTRNRSFGALHQMLSSLDPAGKDDAWQEIEQELQQFEGAGGFVGPCELLVGPAVKELP